MFQVTSYCLGLLLLFASNVQGGCRKDNWWGSFDKKGLSKCSRTSSEYIRGFYRNDRRKPDKIIYLEEAVCCTAPSPYRSDRTQIYYANWWRSFDRQHNWNTCPPGYFLQGMYRTSGHKLWNIEEGRCIKPASHPSRYGRCYDHDIGRSFDKKGTQQCNANYFVTGLYRSGCDQLYCIEKMRCCKMVPKPDAIDSLEKAKTKVMDNTMSQMARLAHYLGYGWCGGCRAPYVGEDFRRQGDTWLADKRGPCSGYKHDYRLSMNYGHWKFSIKSITFGKPVLQELRPDTVDSGVIRNDFPRDVSHTLRRTSHVARTVSHTVTSSWRRSHELGVTFGYTPNSVTGGASGSVSYNFLYETSSSTTDSTGTERTESFSVDESVAIPPYHAVNYTVMLSKTRRTVPYTAKILVHFSTELRGFLRWGGGYHGKSTNYHHKHRGSGKRPTFNYRFGGDTVPFYEALKDQSDSLKYPWLWADLKAKYSSARGFINSLASEGRYEFKLTGKFDDVSGKDLRVNWQEVPFSARRKRSSDQDDVTLTPPTSTAANSGISKPEVDSAVKDVVASEKPGDPPSVFPNPPEVELDPDLKDNTSDDILLDGN